MINYYNYIYLGTLYMGSGPVKQEIVTNFDTGSDWLVVEIDHGGLSLFGRFRERISDDSSWFTSRQ